MGQSHCLTSPTLLHCSVLILLSIPVAHRVRWAINYIQCFQCLFFPNLDQKWGFQGIDVCGLFHSYGSPSQCWFCLPVHLYHSHFTRSVQLTPTFLFLNTIPSLFPPWVCSRFLPWKDLTKTFPWKALPALSGKAGGLSSPVYPECPTCTSTKVFVAGTGGDLSTLGQRNSEGLSTFQRS